MCHVLHGGRTRLWSPPVLIGWAWLACAYACIAEAQTLRPTSPIGSPVGETYAPNVSGGMTTSLPPGTRAVPQSWSQSMPRGTRVAQMPNTAGQSQVPLQVPGNGVLPTQAPPNQLTIPEILKPGIGDAFPGESPETAQRFRQAVPRIIDPEKTLELFVGIPRILVFAETPARIYLPDENVAQYQIIDGTQISIVGQRLGTTSLTIWMPPRAGQPPQVLSYLLKVSNKVPSSASNNPASQTERQIELQAIYRGLERQINEAFPNSRIQLSLVADQVVVRGQAKDVVEASQILSILVRQRPRNLRDEAGREVRTVYEVPIDPELKAKTAETVGFQDSVISAEALGQAGVINLLEIPGEQQVMLRVTVAEVNRNAARSIGLNFAVANNRGTQIFNSTVGQISPAALVNAGGAVQRGLMTAQASLDNGQVNLAINALRTLRLAKTLAEPNLVALNGQTANFQAGGRFPVPITGGFTNNGLQGVAFVPFGVQLGFTPFIVDRDRIRLRINAEVSTRNPQSGATIGGANVNGVDSRNFNTVVELREGQTLAVAGLIQQNFGADSDRMPWFGDLPLIGHAAGFNRTSAGEQELVILITPELVHPLEAHDVPNVPGSDVFEPTDVEFFLGNRLESRRTTDFRSPVRTDYRRQRAGERYCEDQFIIGPHGPSHGCLNMNANVNGTVIPNSAPPATPVAAPLPLPEMRPQ